MSQHDYNLANASGASFRNDLNNVLAAIASVNSGSGSPGTTFAGQVWEDTSTTPSTYKLRNAANNAWVELFQVETDGSFTLAGTGSLTVPDGTTAQRSASPAAGMIRFNTTLSQYEGYDGSAWGNLSAATGKILQVVTAETSTTVSTANELAYTDTTLTASITPSLASSKILIFINQDFYVYNNLDHFAYNGIKVLRDSTAIYVPNENNSAPNGATDYGVLAGSSTNIVYFGRACLTLSDLPNTTSTITYKTQGRPYSTSIVMYQKQGISAGLGTSTITLMEVAV